MYQRGTGTVRGPTGITVILIYPYMWAAAGAYTREVIFNP